MKLIDLLFLILYNPRVKENAADKQNCTNYRLLLNLTNIVKFRTVSELANDDQLPQNRTDQINFVNDSASA